MKKSILIIAGVVFVVPPLIASDLTGTRLSNQFNSKLSANFDSISFRVPENITDISNVDLSNIEIPKEDPDGEIASVIYYGKRENSKEVLDIFLDSHTKNEADGCIMMVSVFNSKGEVEYRLDNVVIRYNGSMHYIIEFDPPLIENEKYRNVRIAATFYSNEDNKHQYLEFNIDYTEKSEYIFEDNLSFTSTYPVAIKYTLDGKIEKRYENFNFESICNLKYNRPIFDISKLGFKYSYDSMEIMVPNYTDCYLLIDEIYDKSDLEEENEMKKIPLSLYYENGQIKFSLIDDYYYDSGDGMIYKTEKNGRSKVNNLILPTTYQGAKEAIYYELHFTNFSSNESNIVFKSYVSFDVKWFGSCDDSYFCVGSIDEILEDVYYSGGVIV